MHARLIRAIKFYLLAYSYHHFEQLFIHQRVIEKKQTKIIYNKHQNTIDMQDYQAYVAYKINCKYSITANVTVGA